MKKEKISIRDLKKAKIKIDLLNSLMIKTKDRTFESINTTELCDDVLISEVTFYKYFKKKTDLLLFHNKVVEVEIWLALNNLPSNHSGKQGLDLIFKIMGNKIDSNLNLMNGFLQVILSNQSLMFDDLTPAEISIAFSELEIQPPIKLSLPLLIMENISRAISCKEISTNIDRELILNSILTILLGSPIAFLLSMNMEVKSINDIFVKQFDILWKGFRV